MENYNPKEIESKWQKIWAENPGLYAAKDDSSKPKWYTLVEFPYPSGAGLHVGHVRSYTALDVVSRKLRMQGYNVLYPIGWDAFGLPTENYAIKNKIHPRKATEENVAIFKRQLKSLGLSYDWSREINTTDPKYYKWTQWIFLQLFKKGLAYKKKLLINWCPNCKIGLANEEVIDDKCERCGTQAVKKEKEQWILAITKYADRLIDDLATVDYLDKIKNQQINWIGRSEGAQFALKIKDSGEKIEVYTTRIDTVFGMTYVVVAPEHEIISNLKNEISNIDEVEKYLTAAQSKTDLERTEVQKEKTGVELKGIKAINPFNGKDVPVFAADYVLGHYGTGAVMAVPAHDERDWEFAKKYNLPVSQSIAPFFSATDGKDAPRRDKETVKRRTIFSIIKHWEKDEYLCLDWEKFGWKSFIIGGVDEGEDSQQAAIREAQEETGYQSIRQVKKITGEVHTNFFAEHKDVNRYGICEGFYIELDNGEFIEPSAEHTKNHKAVWVKKEDIKKFVNLGNNLWYWNALLDGEKAFVDDGIVISSGEYSELSSEEAREKMTAWLEKNNLGGKKVNYKLRDWIFSRQHYWGEPIPIVHCEKCGIVPVDEKDLPIELPDVKSYEPTDTGESPLANITEWVKVKCPICGGQAKRETDTMPNWAGSSWYFLRYIDPDNNEKLADPEKLKHWMPVDLYNGGMEHTTLHLLYSRFWNKFLYDIGVSPVSEPYTRRLSHGMVLAEDGKKMSKSLGNVINPDDIVKEFGADTLRIYEMFMGPFGDAIPWSTDNMIGAKRFLEKVWDYFDAYIIDKNKLPNATSGGSIKLPILNKAIKKVTEDIENFRFNTAISQMMILVNSLREPHLGKQGDETGGATYTYFDNIVDMEKILIILSPFAPHLAEELWEKLKHEESIFLQDWPQHDPELIKDDKIKLVLQINGKVRDIIEVDAEISEEEAKKLAEQSEKIKAFIAGKEIRKVIFVQGRLVNIVV